MERREFMHFNDEQLDKAFTELEKSGQTLKIHGIALRTPELMLLGVRLYKSQCEEFHKEIQARLDELKKEFCETMDYQILFAARLTDQTRDESL